MTGTGTIYGTKVSSTSELKDNSPERHLMKEPPEGTEEQGAPCERVTAAA